MLLENGNQAMQAKVPAIIDAKRTYRPNEQLKS